MTDKDREAPQAETKDPVNHPNHYSGQWPFEVIELIELVLNQLCKDCTPFEAYCIGNRLKYRLRAGLKGDPLEDIEKAMKYKELQKLSNYPR